MADLDVETKNWIFELLEKNMKDYYFQVQYQNVPSTLIHHKTVLFLRLSGAGTLVTRRRSCLRTQPGT